MRCTGGVVSHAWIWGVVLLGVWLALPLWMDGLSAASAVLLGKLCLYVLPWPVCALFVASLVWRGVPEILVFFIPGVGYAGVYALYGVSPSWIVAALLIVWGAFVASATKGLVVRRKRRGG